MNIDLKKGSILFIFICNIVILFLVLGTNFYIYDNNEDIVENKLEEVTLDLNKIEDVVSTLTQLSDIDYIESEIVIDIKAMNGGYNVLTKKGQELFVPLNRVVLNKDTIQQLPKGIEKGKSYIFFGESNVMDKKEKAYFPYLMVQQQ